VIDRGDCCAPTSLSLLFAAKMAIINFDPAPEYPIMTNSKPLKHGRADIGTAPNGQY